MIYYARNATKQGFIIGKEGDGLSLEHPHSTGRRGRVTVGVSHTLDTGGNEATMINGRIRKLTPRECFALQGFDKEEADMLSENGLSDCQLYKQAGNSICVPVLVAIFTAMKEQGLFVGFSV